jgi:PAS domain S-box-containing protein
MGIKSRLFDKTGSIGRRLHQRVLLLASIAMLGLAGAILISLLGARDRLEGQFGVAGMTATQAFDAYLLDVRSDLIATAAALGPSAYQSDLLRQLIARRPTLFELELIDLDGRILLQRNRAGRPDRAALGQQPWLDSVRRGQSYLGPVDFGEFSVPTVTLAAPVSNELGVFSATLVARFDLTTLWNIAISLSVGNSGYIYIADQNGHLVAHRNLRLLYSEDSMEQRLGLSPQSLADGGLHLYTSLYGRWVIGFGSAMELAPWFAIVEQPLAEALGPLLIRVLFMLLALVLAWLLVRSILRFTRLQILRPLVLLREGVERLQAGDLRARTGLEPGRGELKQLGAAFDHMAGQLQGREQQLRQSLTETTELKNLLDNVFSSIVSGVMTTDMDGRISLCNQAALRILGYGDSKALIGQTVAGLVAPLGRILLPHVETVSRSHRPVIGLDISADLPERGAVHLRVNLSELRSAERPQGIAIVIDDVTEMKQMEAQRRLLEHMVSPAILSQIDPERLQLGGQRQVITALFADIHGFTRISEQLTPEKLVGLLNRYLGAMADAVLAEEGTIDKFLGDAIMAWFNAPLPQADHALRAVRTGLQIRDAILQLHKELPEELQLSCGIGIHTGDAVLGLIGSQERIEYTAIGDDVNTAKRLQEHSGINQILISAQIYQAVQADVEVRPLQRIKVKGKQKPLEVYEVVGLKCGPKNML